MATNNVINIGQYSFFAYVNTTTSGVSGDGSNAIISASVAPLNEGSCYNNSTYAYTIPQTGNYFFQANVALTGLSASHTAGSMWIANSSGANYYLSHCSPWALATSFTAIINGSALIHCTAGDTISFYVQVSGGTKVVELYTGTGYWTYISGTLLL